VPEIEFNFIDRSLVDLTDMTATVKFFTDVKPTYVVHLAAKVGGLFANMQDKVGFFE